MLNYFSGELLPKFKDNGCSNSFTIKLCYITQCLFWLGIANKVGVVGIDIKFMIIDFRNLKMCWISIMNTFRVLLSGSRRLFL
jgi:hypothetical protein